MTATIEDLVIIGAGPAGLAAANAAAKLNPLVIDSGPTQHQRGHSNLASVIQGVGGAGLFSDGKFSFWPSGSELWKLDPELLRQAYVWFRAQLTSMQIDAPLLPTEPTSSHLTPIAYEKRYPSIYATFDDRYALISRLAASVRRVVTGTEVTSLSHKGGIWRLDSNTCSVQARNVVLATGRYGPLLMQKALPPSSLRFLRVEVGVRIEQEAEQFFLADHPRLDPKFIWRDPSGNVEWRTFCCCRNGLVVWTAFQGIYTASGRADCPPTGRSNIGFNVRLMHSSSATDAWPHILRTVTTRREPAAGQIQTLLRGHDASNADPMGAFGPVTSARLAQGLDHLLQDFPGRGLEQATLIGPTLEGVGWYPVHDAKLSTQLPGLLVAGDAAGSFRGLTAALVSGYVAGTALLQGGKHG